MNFPPPPFYIIPPGKDRARPARAGAGMRGRRALVVGGRRDCDPRALAAADWRHPPGDHGHGGGGATRDVWYGRRGTARLNRQT